MNYDQAAERYRNDPMFHRLVRAMMDSIGQLQFSPGELREAAVFAETLFYQRNPTPHQRRQPPGGEPQGVGEQGAD
jgi:hypothetical protein